MLNEACVAGFGLLFLGIIIGMGIMMLSVTRQQYSLEKQLDDAFDREEILRKERDSLYEQNKHLEEDNMRVFNMIERFKHEQEFFLDFIKNKGWEAEIKYDAFSKMYSVVDLKERDKNE